MDVLDFYRPPETPEDREHLKYFSFYSSICFLLEKEGIISTSVQSTELQQENKKPERTLAQTINAPAVELFHNELNQEFERIRKIIEKDSGVEKSDLRRLIEISLALIMTRNSKAVLNPDEVRVFIKRLFDLMFCVDVNKGSKAKICKDKILFNEADFVKRLESMADFVTRYTDPRIEQRLNSREFQDFLVAQYPDEATRPKPVVTAYLGLGKGGDCAHGVYPSLYFVLNPGIESRNFKPDLPNMHKVMHIGENLGLVVCWLSRKGFGPLKGYPVDFYKRFGNILHPNYVISADANFANSRYGYFAESGEKWKKAFLISKKFGIEGVGDNFSKITDKNWGLLFRGKNEETYEDGEVCYFLYKSRLTREMSKRWLFYNYQI